MDTDKTLAPSKGTCSSFSETGEIDWGQSKFQGGGEDLSETSKEWLQG
jgi:hypothetical protein